MQDDFIVRIFVHGLLLLAPEYDATTQEVIGISILLLDERKDDPSNPDHHTPMLMYCKDSNSGGEYCATPEKVELPKNSEFEQLRISWKEREGRSSARNTKIVLDDSAGQIRTPFPARASEGRDFDWILNLSAALGAEEPLKLIGDCTDTPPGQHCDLVARVSLSEGTVSTCEFVADKSGKIPSINVVSPGRPPQRAMAGIVMIKLERSLEQVEALVIEGDEREWRIEEESNFENECPGEGLCVDVAITNVPPETEWDGKGEHFRMFYELVRQPSGVQLHSYPMVVRGAARRSPGDVQEPCPMPAEFYKVLKFAPVRKKGFLAWLGRLFQPGDPLAELNNIQNRPICPPGTI